LAKFVTLVGRSHDRNNQLLLNEPAARDHPALLLQPKSRQATPAYEAASEHNPSLCSNPRLDASRSLRDRWRRKAAEV